MLKMVMPLQHEENFVNLLFLQGCQNRQEKVGTSHLSRGAYEPKCQLVHAPTSYLTVVITLAYFHVI